MNERDVLLEAVRARLARVAATRDEAAVLEPTALVEAQLLTRCASTPMADLEAAHSLGWLHFYRAQALASESDWEKATAFFKGCFIAGIEHLPQSLLPTLTDRAVPGAMNLLQLASKTMDRDLLEGAVDLWRRIAHNVPDGHPNLIIALTNLGNGLEMLGERTGRSVHLAEAVEVARAALRITPDYHPDRGAPLNLLANALLRRFERAGNLADLDEAVEMARTAVQATDNDPDRVSSLTNLANALLRRFRYRKLPGDLDDAVEMSRAAVRAAPDDHPDRAVFLTNVANALRFRFLRSGSLADLDEAEEVGRAAVQITPDKHPGLVASLGDLGKTLAVRFEHTGDLGDLNRAVDVCRAAIHATPDDHLWYSHQLASLSGLLQLRFGRLGSPADLDEAVQVGEAAVQAAPDDHPDRAAFLSELGNALLARFNSTRDQADLDRAIDASRAAVRSLPDGHPAQAVRLSNLSGVLAARSLRARDNSELAEAVEVGRAAIRATQVDDPGHATALFNLGIHLVSWDLCVGDPTARAEAHSVLEQAVEATTAPPWLRVDAARMAAGLLASSDPGRAAGLLERAVLILPQVVQRRLQRGDQQHALARNADGLAADAAALALADSTGTAQERAIRALRLAEAGRAVLLSQALETRSDLTDLRKKHPDLAGRLTQLRELLDRDRPSAETMGDTGDVAGIGRERHQLAAELEELLERIRAFDGFTAFGLPPTPDTLLAEAAHGPIVTFNISVYRSDALLLTRAGITSCPLPELTQDAVRDRVNAFYRALSEATAHDGDPIAAQRTLREVLEWLWNTAAKPVLSALQDLGEAIPPAQDGQPLPRVWLAPGGLLGQLPLHAAGFHRDPRQGSHRPTVMDRVISSYTPTIRALRHARERRPSPAGQSLIVAMPTTPGCSPLRHVVDETRRIRPLLPHPYQLTEPFPAGDGSTPFAGADTPTTATVLARLPQCAISHFACHGEADRTNPSQSRLLLHDHATTPLTVSALAQINLERAQLAYLSACSTADPARSDLLDESIHLASAFQLAGFPHVIGTLWPIDDQVAVKIAESFYTHLTTGPPGTPDPEQAATALHRTIRAVRDNYPITPSLWAAYLHAGA
ncbi:CHAT domain-containing protein [Amycolatopsis balhimycina DSM 5908]|uniref:CHAT domain-containing protein n=1 Tax=Amycolatopsis balhimycina DSM 5908 TaxID=1081091 RepID=A0A428WPC1_AMYBA|nr:CHAT domain-containing protein [Amycolatopsis balhimycina]RSM44903.1 CHAT domain-containing protein [Amycolatopsis balhimycina DSM 5908]